MKAAAAAAVSASGKSTFVDVVVGLQPIKSEDFPYFPIDDNDVRDVDFDKVCLQLPRDEQALEELVAATSTTTQKLVDDFRDAAIDRPSG